MSAVEIRTPRRRTGLVLLVIGLLVIVAVILFVAVFAVANRGRGAPGNGP